MDDEQIKKMVDRFLKWQLPEDFAPDGGISYKKPDYEMPTTGTNLFDATQAEQMIRYMLAVPDKTKNTYKMYRIKEDFGRFKQGDIYTEESFPELDGYEQITLIQDYHHFVEVLPVQASQKKEK